MGATAGNGRTRQCESVCAKTDARKERLSRGPQAFVKNRGRPARRSLAELLHQLSVPVEDLLGGLLEGGGIKRALGPVRLHFMDEVEHLGALLRRQGLDLVDYFVSGHQLHELRSLPLVRKLVLSGFVGQLDGEFIVNVGVAGQPRRVGGGVDLLEHPDGCPKGGHCLNLDKVKRGDLTDGRGRQSLMEFSV